MQGPWDFKPAVEFIKNNLQYFVDLWAPDYFLNINFPSQLTENFELRRTYPCRRVYCDEYHRVDPPRGPIYFFPYGYLDCDNPQEGSDLEAVLQGHISISPIKVDPTAHDINEEIKRQMDNWEGSHEQRNRKETISGR
jgi:broad specificity polyphosphatase/5'/3'-nucleotidase SurE